MIIFHELGRYWAWAGSNIGAMPACSAIAVMATVIFRKPLARWWHKHFGAKADLAEIRDMAAAAHRIAADLYHHHTGQRHELAPDRESEGE